MEERNRLSRNGKRHLLESLEHLMVIGESHRYAKDRLLRHSSELTAPNHQLIHAEDERIYSAIKNKNKKQKKAKDPGPRANDKDSNEAWDLQHGDSIHPIAFAKAQLTQQQNNHDDDDHRVGTVYSTIEKDTNQVQQHEVPKALLLRCWERAVHAASSTISLEPINNNNREGDGTLCPDENGENDKNNNQNNQQIDHSAIQHPHRNVSQDDKNVRDRYQLGGADKARSIYSSLGLKFPVNVPSSTDETNLMTCPSCSVCFRDLEQLENHFFGAAACGSDTSNTDADNGNSTNHRWGCCWHLIQQKHLQLMQDALLVESKTVTKLVCEQVANKLAGDQNYHLVDQHEEKSLSWNEILGALEKVANQQQQHHHHQQQQLSNNEQITGISPASVAKARRKKEDPETHEVRQRLTMSNIDANVLEDINRRVVDRYSNLPL